MGVSDGTVLGDILVYVYIITLDIYAGTELGSLDGSYGVGNLDGSFLGELFESDDVVEAGATNDWSEIF